MTCPSIKKKVEESSKEKETPPTLEVNVYDKVGLVSVGPGGLKKKK